jgi:hypothetical protein
MAAMPTLGFHNFGHDSAVSLCDTRSGALALHPFVSNGLPILLLLKALTRGMPCPNRPAIRGPAWPPIIVSQKRSAACYYPDPKV